MKPKDEIEKLYHKCWDDFSNKYDDNLHYYSFVEGYTKCREDMIEKLEMHILINEDDWNRNPHTQLKDFINSLNKQD
jgi:hypothetical protein